MLRILFGLLAVCGLTMMMVAAEPATKPDRETLETEFAAKLTNSKLAGGFSIDGKDLSGSKPDKYDIVSAKKLKGDDWLITAKMKVGQQEIPVPIPLKVYWADDTPVMSLTDLTIPGVGTFTARVMFHGSRYAGTWQHGDVGGEMWGVVEKADAPKK